MVQYLYNSSGEWIAFRDGEYVYEPNGDLIGFLTEQNGQDVADLEMRYFGTLYGDRLYRKLFPPVVSGFYPGYPGKHPRPDLPVGATPEAVPMEADEIRELTPA